MASYPQRARERAMKVEEVILRAVSKQITFWQAAWILRISPRHLRRVMQRYRRCGFDGLLDGRKGRPSAKRLPWAVAEQVLCLYREKYFDFSVRHFHEKLREEHGILYSYTCIKLLLQGAGLVVRARQRGPHRLRATGRRGIHRHGSSGAARGHRAERAVLRAVQRSRQPFLADAQGRRDGRPAKFDASGPGDARVGHRDDSRVFAASAGTERTELPNLAEPSAASVAGARHPGRDRRQPFSARELYRGAQREIF